MTSESGTITNHFAAGVRFDLAVFTDKTVYVQMADPALVAELARIREEVALLRREAAERR